MVNKKGIIRIVEASIAILIILGALLLLSSYKEKNESDEIEKILEQSLDEMAQDDEMREEILGNEEVLEKERAVENFLKRTIKNPSLNFTVKICGLEDDCSLEQLPENAEGDIFSSERVISVNVGSIEEVSSKRVKVFAWRKTK